MSAWGDELNRMSSGTKEDYCGNASVLQAKTLHILALRKGLFFFGCHVNVNVICKTRRGCTKGAPSGTDITFIQTGFHRQCLVARMSVYQLNDRSTKDIFHTGKKEISQGLHT